MALERTSPFLHNAPDKPRGGSGDDYDGSDSTNAISEGVLEVVPGGEVKVEFLHYGKRVDKEDRNRVPYQEGYGNTGFSSGFELKSFSAVSWTGIMGRRTGTQDFIDDSRGPGALAIRSLPNGNIAAVRAQYHSEGGDDTAGRIFQQSTSWVIPGQYFEKYASAIGAEISDRLHTELVSVRVPWQKLEGQEAQKISVPEHAIVSIDHLDEDARFLADILLKPRDSKALIPSGRFTDEKSFLMALGKALETLKKVAPEKITDIRILVGGLKEDVDLEPQWIQYNPPIPEKLQASTE